MDFKNHGTSVKKLASFLSIAANILATVVATVGVFIAFKKSEPGYLYVCFLGAVLLLAVGNIYSLFMFAIGELVEDTGKIRRHLLGDDELDSDDENENHTTDDLECK